MTQNDLEPKLNFEKALEKLEAIVSDLEKGELDLDQSIKKYEEGVDLYKICSKKLKDADCKIKILTQKLEEEEFEE